MTALRKEFLSMDITKDTDPMGTNDPIKIDTGDRANPKLDQAAPQPRPKLPAYVHPH